MKATGQDLQIEITAPSGRGHFNPSSIFVPAGQNVQVNPLIFVPAAGFTGGTIQVILEGFNEEGQPCSAEQLFDLPVVNSFGGGEGASIQFSPNPVKSTTTMEYSTGNKGVQATSIVLYDLNGMQQITQELTGDSGQKILDLSHLGPGQYVAVLRLNNGKRIQKSLIKQ